MLRYIFGVSLITAVIMIVRALTDGKMLRKHQYALWLLIPVFMIISPFIKIGIPVNMPVPVISDNISTDAVRSQAEEGNIAVAPVIESAARPVDNTGVRPVTDDIRTGKDIWIKTGWKTLSVYICLFVSALITGALSVYNTGFILYCKRKRRYIGKDPDSGLEIYGIRHEGTPFLLLNKIYVYDETDSLNKYIICHEACHYKHGDSWWIILRYLVLALNWYNPVIWLAFILSGCDSELACDEEVVRILGEGSSVDYATELLNMIKQRSDAAFGFTVSTGMRGEYKMIKKRLLSITHPAKKSYKALALSLMTLFVFAGCGTTELVPAVGKTPEPEKTEETTESTGGSPVVLPTEGSPAIKETDVYLPEYASDYSDSPLYDIGKGHLLTGGGLYMAAMTPVCHVEEDGTKSYVVYPWRILEVSQEFIDTLEAGKEVSLETEAKLTVLETLDLEPDLYTFTVQGIEERYVESDHARWRWITQYTGNRVYVLADEERGLNFRETTTGTWALFEYDLPVMIVSKPTRLKVSPDVKLYDSVHYLKDIDESGIVLDAEERQKALQCDVPEGYVGSIDEFFWRGCTSTYSENTPFDTSVDNHTFTGIVIDHNVIQTVLFF